MILRRFKTAKGRNITRLLALESDPVFNACSGVLRVVFDNVDGERLQLDFAPKDVAAIRELLNRKEDNIDTRRNRP